MRRLLLDTTFLIDADRGGDVLDQLIDDDDDVALAAVTIAELGVGVLLAEGKSRSDRLAFVQDVLTTIDVVDYDLSVAVAHAELLVEVRRQGRPRGAHDLIIAATAKASSRTVLTADRSAFDDLTGVSAEPHRHL